MTDTGDAWDLFVSAPRNTGDLLLAELQSLGAVGAKGRGDGVGLRGDRELAYRICLESRLASRVFLELHRFAAPDAEALYRGGRDIPWGDHLDPQTTFAIDATARHAAIDHTGFAALKLKDALVDQLRDDLGERPSVDTEAPDLRFRLHLEGDQATVSLDLAGEALHRRGYRADGASAPLKENLAAAILIRVGWPELAAAGAALVDPTCGSGTLLIEAALIAADVAPGLARGRFGFSAWAQHDEGVLARLRAAAEERRERGLAGLAAGRLFGSDRSAEAIAIAARNVEAAGLTDRITLTCADLGEAIRPASAERGLVISNPPYGERLQAAEPLPELYARLGQRLREGFVGWRAAVLTNDRELGQRLGLRAKRRNVLFNGPLECSLLRFELTDEPPRPAPDLSDSAFANRLRKNKKRLGRWAAKRGVTCYRLYDADIPEFAVAVDLYADHVHVQEYHPPAEIEERQAKRRLAHVMAAVPQVLGLPRERVHLKVRRKQKGKQQYERLDRSGELIEVPEGGHLFLVNLVDYLDTGLFLDHRLTRARVAELAPGRDFLNLFAYTASATVYAAKAGARLTLSVDLSNTYLRWAEQNLRLNGVEGRQHDLLRTDCVEFLTRHPRQYGLIFLDPPTFSNSKALEAPFDLQRQHVDLLRAAAARLTSDGVLIFSNNYRRFRLDREALPELDITDITAETIDEDFKRNPRIHNCFQITRR